MGNEASSEENKDSKQTSNMQNNMNPTGSQSWQPPNQPPNLNNNAAPAPGWSVPQQPTAPSPATPSKTGLYPQPPSYDDTFPTKQPIGPHNPTAPQATNSTPHQSHAAHQNFIASQQQARPQYYPSPQSSSQQQKAGPPQFYAQPPQQFFSQPPVSSHNYAQPIKPSMPISSSAMGLNTDIWVSSHRGNIPQNAFRAGHDTDGSQIFVCRAAHGSDIVPGKIVVTHTRAYIPYEGEEHAKGHFEILVGDRYRWIPSNGGNVPPNAVEGGRCGSGEKLYIGRAKYNNSLTPGKIHPSHRCLYIPYGGQEKHFTEYEILIYCYDKPYPK